MSSSEAKGKASEVAGEVKGKAHELAGEAKGKKEEIKGKLWDFLRRGGWYVIRHGDRWQGLKLWEEMKVYDIYMKRNGICMIEILISLVRWIDGESSSKRESSPTRQILLLHNSSTSTSTIFHLPFPPNSAPLIWRGQRDGISVTAQYWAQIGVKVLNLLTS